ncbi:hypothetical protein B0H14DRAFT_3539950 [Mycena olivaceomarginata]|nr:hypothetical protein B0H14DRAFT_3539950 [Mycena olivaceomarginata]
MSILLAGAVRSTTIHRQRQIHLWACSLRCFHGFCAYPLIQSPDSRQSWPRPILRQQHIRMKTTWPPAEFQSSSLKAGQILGFRHLLLFPHLPPTSNSSAMTQNRSFAPAASTAGAKAPSSAKAQVDSAMETLGDALLEINATVSGLPDVPISRMNATVADLCANLMTITFAVTDVSNAVAAAFEAAPDTISVRAYLQPGEAYGTRITMEPTREGFTKAGEAEEGTSAQLEKSELLRCPALKAEGGAKTLCSTQAW